MFENIEKCNFSYLHSGIIKKNSLVFCQQNTVRPIKGRRNNKKFPRPVKKIKTKY